MTSEAFDWNGICSGEPPGLDIWRWSKSAATSADELVEEALGRADEELRSQADAYPDPESYGEAQYHLVEEPASFARSGLFCQLAGSFEFALLGLCNDAAMASNSAAMERSGREIVMGRLRYLGKTTGVNFTDAAEEVRVLAKLRNAFAHADGILMDDDDQRSIERWIHDHQGLVHSTGHAIRLKEGFVRYCIATYDQKLADIGGAIVAKMRTRTADHPVALPPVLRGV